MTVLEIVSRSRETEAVFRRYDSQAGECILCRSLFDPVEEVATKYNLDLEVLLSDLEAARSRGEGE